MARREWEKPATMRTTSSFSFEVKDRVGTITLNRPDRLNALTFEVYRELTDFFWQLETEPSVAAVVITGAGRGFCSGGDVEAIIGQLLSRDAAGLLDFTRLTCGDAGQQLTNDRFDVSAGTESS